jgi:hypothetical protein
MTIPDIKIKLAQFWFNRSTKTKLIIVSCVALILFII